MSFQTTKEITFDGDLPLVRISNVPGRYLGEIIVDLDSLQKGFTFYFEFENVDHDWSASNACCMCMTKGDTTKLDTVRRVTSTNDLEFFIRVPGVTTANGRVSVTVMGTHEPTVINIPDDVSSSATSVPYTDGYREKGWTMELGRLQYYQDIFA